jgi:hypothetical protein
VDVNAAVEGLQCLATRAVHEGLARHDAAGINGQSTQQLELVTGQRPLLAVEAHQAGLAIDLQAPEPQARRALPPCHPTAPQDGPHACQQLARVKGLG